MNAFRRKCRRAYIDICRRHAPKRYIRIELAKLYKALNGPRRFNISSDPSYIDPHQRIGDEIDDLREWEQSIEDKELQIKAKKIGVYIDAIEFNKPKDETIYHYYYRYGAFGHELLFDELRKLLLKAVREREPLYRKERREQIELYTKIGAVLITAITGVLGAATGLVALLKR